MDDAPKFRRKESDYAYDKLTASDISQAGHLPSSENLLGTIVAGKYEILTILGSGGMGVVYKCRQLVTGETYAIKLLHAHLSLDGQALRRFELEATAASRIVHPNAISIVDIGNALDGRPYLVTEFVDGISLSEHLGQVGRLPILVASAIFVQVCDALDEAHRLGVIHRDIKPGNIMLKVRTDGVYQVKVVDFGIAKLVPREGDGTFVETGTGKLIGSPPYMSPEQCMGARLDFRSDIYSMGCVMYESLMGVPPLLGSSPMETMYRHLHDLPTPLAGMPEDIRLIQRMNQIITKALQKSVIDRYQTVAELRNDLVSIESKSKKWQSIAFLQLYLSSVLGKFVNAVGSSRLTMISIALLTIVFISVASCFLIPYVVVPGPTAAQKRIDWQTLPQPSTANLASTLLTTQKLKSLSDAVQKCLKTEGAISPEAISLHVQVADLYFDDECYSIAEYWYFQVLDLSGKLFKNTYSNYQATPAIVHTLGKASERYAECELRLKHYQKALMLAKSGIKWSFSDVSSDDSYKAYFCHIQGVATAKLGGPDEVINENCDNFIRYVKTVGAKGTDSGKVAQALSDIADIDFEAGKWQRALQVLDMAQEAWARCDRSDETTKPGSAADRYKNYYKPVLHTGSFNMAVAHLKKAIALQKLGRGDESFTQLEKAAEIFESINGKNDLERSKILFREADYLWTNQQFVKSWLTRIEAMKTWSLGQRIEHQKVM
jgi:serine/threonine protein kinase